FFYFEYDRSDLSGIWRVDQRPVQLGRHSLTLIETCPGRRAAEVYDRLDPANDLCAEQLGPPRKGRRPPFPQPPRPKRRVDQRADQSLHFRNWTRLRYVDRVRHERGPARREEVQVPRQIVTRKVGAREHQQSRRGRLEIAAEDAVDAPSAGRLDQRKHILRFAR